jgi:nuclear pore complex protein Nup43
MRRWRLRGKGEVATDLTFLTGFFFALPPGMAIKGEDVAAVGEAGDIHLVHLGVSPGGPVKNNSASQHRVIKSADSFTLSSVIYLKPQEVLTANSSGQLKMWDLRQALKNSADAAKPSKILLMSGERIGVTALAQHPTQPHILASGGADGLLTIWDLRQDKAPATLLQGHSSPVWDIKFHPSQPDHLFTCADEGKVLHWDAASVVEGANKTKGLVGSLGTSRVGPLSMAPSHGVNSQSPWIASGTTGDKKSNIVTSTLLPSYFNMSVNSMDIESDILICGTDAEAIFTVRNLNIH